MDTQSSHHSVYSNSSSQTSILGRIVRVTDEVIDYRNWVRESFGHRFTQQVVPAVPSAVVKQLSMAAIVAGVGHKHKRGSASSSETSEDSDLDSNGSVENRQPGMHRSEITPRLHSIKNHQQNSQLVHQQHGQGQYPQYAMYAHGTIPTTTGRLYAAAAAAAINGGGGGGVGSGVGSGSQNGGQYVSSRRSGGGGGGGKVRCK